MRVYDLYGVGLSSLSEARLYLASVFDYFQEKESSYRGVCFKCSLNDGGEVVLQENWEDGDYAEDKYTEFKVLLYVNSIKEFDEIRNNLIDLEKIVSLTRDVSGDDRVMRSYVFKGNKMELIRECILPTQY